MLGHCAVGMVHARWLNSAASMAGDWLAMMAAMMAPLLMAPIRHACERSLPRRRWRAAALFTAGYLAVWMAVGVVLMAVAQAAGSGWKYGALAIVLAMLWQMSPAKQRCLNRCHAHPALAAFGFEADVDALGFGWTHGLWCAGSCWALMLVPMMVSRGHLMVMAAVSVWLFAEQLERPGPPSWRLRGLGKALRITIAQTRTLVG